MNDKNQEIPEMNLDNKYKNKQISMSPDSEKIQKEMDKTKKELDKLKTSILKKFPITQSLSILPPQGIQFFIKEEEVPKETEKYIQLYMVIPEDKFKEIPKIKKEVVSMVTSIQEKLKQKIWIQIKTPVDIWETCMDSKFELLSAIAMSIPIYDKGLLSGLRVSEIHKSMVLQKFEKYVVSYVLGGSFVRGDTIKESDIDVFIVINDTDVKRMARVELLERLRGIIYSYIPEASALAGVPSNMLNVQVYLLTDFWQSVKDANPVIFTFIRDGVPIYDRGTFMPWKALLKMGKLKPSPEAIDMFMSMGDNSVKRVKKALLDIVLHDIYWSILTPSQAMVMLYGEPPPTTKDTYKEMKKIFVDKEKMLELKYIKILEEITIKYYKGFEHGKVKEVTGREVDKLVKNSEDYLNRLKELRSQIEKQTQKKTIQQVYKDVFDLLKSVTKKTNQKDILAIFEKDFVKKGIFPPQNARAVKKVIEAKELSKKGKLTLHKADEARKASSSLMNNLIDYAQRKDIAFFERGKMMIRHGKNQISELISTGKKAFLVQGSIIKEIADKIEMSSMEELSKALKDEKKDKNIKINPKVFELLKKEFGEYELLI